MTPCDLRTERLFPVVLLDGKTSHMGLRELLLNAHQVRDLAVMLPPAFSGMLRVLYTIAARVTGLDQATSDGEWHRQRLLHLDKHEFDANAVNT
jgi:CRISPR system Cascade subunit CasA